jgi:1-acyl-sn-glycerol-3-phosphate acyltransferase
MSTTQSLLIESVPARPHRSVRAQPVRKRWINWYRLSTGFGRFCFWNSVNFRCIRRDAPERDGPYILAGTHLSHIEPFLMSIIVRRQIDWMARIEFYTYRLFSWMMLAVDSIPVRRFGVSANAIRTAIERLQQGRCVGICPEGGVAQGKNSVMRGAPMKKGVCLIAARANVPVLPCIMLGTDKLNRVAPWIPFRRANLWVAFGSRLVYPRTDEPDRRKARELMAQDLSREYQALYAELCQTHGIADSDVP